MPLRNERQAYWDDIENNIARVQPLSASRALDRVCPDAAAERLALKSRLRDVEEETRQVNRLRARAAAEANVLSREADAMLNLEAKERAFEEAQRFVRGRLQNDRPDGQRLGMRPPERLSRAAVGAPKEDRLRAAAPFAVRAPAAHAHAHRERNERWGSGEVSPLMGGGYTVVMERAHRDLEDAVDRQERAERERKLYFMESGICRRRRRRERFAAPARIRFARFSRRLHRDRPRDRSRDRSRDARFFDRVHRYAHLGRRLDQPRARQAGLGFGSVGEYNGKRVRRADGAHRRRERSSGERVFSVKAFEECVTRFGEEAVGGRVDHLYELLVVY